MKIDNLFESTDSPYIYLERFVNNGSPSGFSKNTTSIDTCPQGKNGFFNLPIIQFDETIDVEEIGESKFFDLPRNCVFCHPDNLELDFLKGVQSHWKIIDSIKVSPTASGRTVKCVGDNKFFIKLDYFGMLGRLPRNLDKKKLLSAYEVSNDLNRIFSTNKTHSTSFYFDEDFGRIAKIPLSNGSCYEMGFVLRNDKPYPINQKIRAYIPFFSLFARDKFYPKDEYISLQIFKKQSKPINDFCIDLIKMVIDLYFDVLLNSGMCLEAHAQNMLLCVDENLQIVGVAARDLESVDKDLPLREFLNLSTNFTSFPYKCLKREDYNYTIMHSFMFDFKLGCYLIEPLLESLSSVPNFNSSQITESIKEYVQKYIAQLPTDYFPTQWYNYDNEIFDRSKRRPYIAHDNPRYR